MIEAQIAYRNCNMGWFRDTFIGDPGRYNYADMCIPQMPWKKSEDKKAINFYAKGMSSNTRFLQRYGVVFGFYCRRRPLQFSSHHHILLLLLDEKIPIFLAIIMGLQHSFAMVGGLITPPLVIFRFTVCGFANPCPKLEQYAISAALITSGIGCLINVSKIPIPFSDKLFGRILYLGSGVLSVVGTSFTFLPVYEVSINQMIMA